MKAGEMYVRVNTGDKTTYIQIIERIEGKTVYRSIITIHESGLLDVLYGDKLETSYMHDIIRSSSLRLVGVKDEDGFQNVHSSWLISTIHNIFNCDIVRIDDRRK